MQRRYEHFSVDVDDLATSNTADDPLVRELTLDTGWGGF